VHRLITKSATAALAAGVVAGLGVLGFAPTPAGAAAPQVDLTKAVCHGIAGCTPVLSGSIQVPGGTNARPGSAETTVVCPADAIAANFGATSPSGSVDVDVNAEVAILNGIPYDRMFNADNTGSASTFQAAVGCVHIADGGVSRSAGETADYRDDLQSASTTPAQPVVHFKFAITGVATGKLVTVIYSDGADGGRQTATNAALAISGGIGTIQNLVNGFVLTGTAAGPLNATVENALEVEPGELDGSILLPAGTTATLTNEKTNQTIQLSSGSFSIPTGV
jgi:hypothetical protein